MAFSVTCKINSAPCMKVALYIEAVILQGSERLLLQGKTARRVDGGRIICPRARLAGPGIERLATCLASGPVRSIGPQCFVHAVRPDAGHR